MNEQNWPDQIRKLLEEYQLDNYGGVYDYGNIDFDSFLDSSLDENNIHLKEFALILIRSRYHSVLEFFLHIFEEALLMTESPIEAAMFTALAHLGGERMRSVRYELPNYSTGDPKTDDNLVISPQKSFGKYRVDFYLKYYGLRRDFESDKETWFYTELIVECDGHDYHERTKEQASRDKKRDRAIQGLGYTIFRYTGADIFNDVFNHASEAIEYLLDRKNFKKLPVDQWPFGCPA